MESNIQIFKNAEFGEIRVAGTADNPMFCLADVCKALGLQNASKVKERLDAGGVQMLDIAALTTSEGVSISQLGNTLANFINEPNLFRCIFQSKKENAKAFQDWVFNDVLPTIRKTGQYALRVPQTFADALQLAADQQRQIEKQKALIGTQQEQIADQQPKVEYFDDLIDRKLLTNFRDTAKELGFKPKEFVELLLAKKYIYRDAAGTLKPFSKHSELFTIKEYSNDRHTGVQTLITPRGKAVFRELYQKNTVNTVDDETAE